MLCNDSMMLIWLTRVSGSQIVSFNDPGPLSETLDPCRVPVRLGVPDAGTRFFISNEVCYILRMTLL